MDSFLYRWPARSKTKRCGIRRPWKRKYRGTSNRLKETVDEAIRAIERVTPSRLVETVHVQGYDKSVFEAIYHVVEHFSLHTGQILYATKLLRKEDLGFYKHLYNPRHNEKTP